MEKAEGLYPKIKEIITKITVGLSKPTILYNNAI